MAGALALRRKGRREAVSTSALLGYQPTLTLPCFLAGALRPPGAQTPRSTEGRCPIYSYQENAYLIFYFDLSGLGQHNLEH